MAVVRCVALLVLVAGLSGCSTLDYYAHLAIGQTHILLERQPITDLIADPHTDAHLRQRLQLALDARRFASNALDLPRNRSYTTYVDIGRPFVMYNVFATPALSLKPVKHCFPFAGCVAYQGFYQLHRARQLAARLRKAGDDVYIGGVPAYSTLGHFADPVLSSMDRWDDAQLVGTIFHELAHQKLYVKGDTAFNESFATFVQREGLRQWRRARHLPPPDRARVRQRHQFRQLILATRARLDKVYSSDLPDATKYRRKRAAFAALRTRYWRLRDTRWHGLDAYDHWIETPLNNAKLLPFGLYDEHVAPFARLFRQCGRNWQRFYRQVRAIAGGGDTARHAFLQDQAESTAACRG